MLQFLASIKGKNTTVVRDGQGYLFREDTVKTLKYPQIRAKYSFLLALDNVIGQGRDIDLKDRERRAKRIVDGENISNEI